MPTVTETQILDIQADPTQVLKATVALEAQYSAFTKVVGASSALGKEFKESSAKADAARGNVNGLNNTLRSLGYGISDVFSNNGNLGQKLQGFSNNVSGIVSGVLQMMGKIGPGAIVAAAGLEIGFTAVGAALNSLGVKSLADLGRLITGGVKEIEHGIDGLKARIKELEDKPVKLSMDLQQLQEAQTKLDKLQKGLAAFRAMEDSLTERKQKSAAAAARVLQEADEPKLAEQLRAKAAKDIIAGDPSIAIAQQKAFAARAKAQTAEQEAKAQQIDDEIMQGKRPISDRIPRAPRLPGAPVVPPEQLKAQAEAARKEAQAADEAVNKRLAEIKGPKGEAEARVGDAREAARRGDVGPMAKQLKGAGRGDLAVDLEATSPQAMKEQEKAFRLLQQFVGSDLPIAFRRLGEDLKLRQNDKAMADAMRQGGTTESPEDREALVRRRERELLENRRKEFGGVERLPGGVRPLPPLPPRDPADFNRPRPHAEEGPQAMAPGGATGIMGALAETLVGALATGLSRIPRVAGEHNAGKTTEEIIRGQKAADAERNAGAAGARFAGSATQDEEAAARQRHALEMAATQKPVGPHGAGGVRGGRVSDAAGDRARKGQRQMRAKAQARLNAKLAKDARKAFALSQRQNKVNVRPAIVGGGKMMGPQPGQGLRAAGPDDAAQAIGPLTQIIGQGQAATSALAGGVGQLGGTVTMLARQQAMIRQDTQRALKMVGQAGETALNMGGPGG